ncbi:hypothetical protein Tco_0162854 [Tanacetum coccineum]
MVAYLQKPEGSESFHQIVDFINANHIKYALIENPTIYISLIQQFWGTSTARTTNDGEVEITANIDGQVKTIIEASLRRHLKLEDSDADEAAFISVDVNVGGAATTDIGLYAGRGSGTIHKTPTRPHDSPLLRVHTLGSDEDKNEDAKEDSSKQGRKIFEIDKDPTISLVQPEQDIEYDFEVNIAEGFTTASVPVTNVGIEISTASILVSIASAVVTTVSASISTVSPPRVPTAEDISGAKTLVYIRRSASKDKGKGIMIETEPEQITIKLIVAKVNQDHDIDWIDPVVLRYHTVQNRSFFKAEVRKNMCIYLKNQGGYKKSHFKGMSYEDIRPIFERVWDQNHAFVPKDSKIEKEVMKRPGFDLQQESTQKNEKIKSKQVEEEIVQQEDVVVEQVVIESSKKAGGRLKRKLSKARKDKDKRQKIQDDPEKLTLKEYVEVISDSKEVIGVIPLAVKSPIVSWKSYCKGDVGYYEIHKADGSYKTYIFFSEMLNDFDREDLIVLYRLLNEKYASTRPVHFLMLGEVSIHILVEKKYPLPQDTLTRMLQWKLHVNNDVTEMAYELLSLGEDCWELRASTKLILLDQLSTAQIITTSTNQLVLPEGRESLSEALTHFKDLLQKFLHHGIDLWLQALLEDLALYDNESWNDPWDFTKSVKAIALPQDVPIVIMTLSIAWKTLNEPLLNMHPRALMKREVRKLNSMLESLGLVPRSSNAKFIYSKEDYGEVMFIKIIRDDEPQCEDPNEGEGATTKGPAVEYFDTFPTIDELTYYRYLMSNPIPSILLRNPIVMEGYPSNLKITCNIGYAHI